MMNWRRITRDKAILVSGLGLALLAAIAILAPVLSPQDPLSVDLGRRVVPGFWSPKAVTGFWLGTDNLGRDVLSRVLVGSRVTLVAGLLPTVLATLLGIVVGSLVMFSKPLDAIGMRLMDVLFSFPHLLLAMFVVALLGAGLTNAVIAIALVNLPRMARAVRAQVIVIMEQEFVEASRALGNRAVRLFVRHVLPGVVPILVVHFSLTAGRSILTIAGLSFLGLGARPPTPEWGSMLSEARELMFVGAWWAVILPGLAIFVTVLLFNMFGDALRDALDPRRG